MDSETPNRRRKRFRHKRPANQAGQNLPGHRAEPKLPRLNATVAGTLPLKSIDIGEPDANAEYFMAKKAKRLPMYLRAYYDWNATFSHELERGEKFLLHGQKGTGKTAILRHLENSSRSSYSTEFIVFRKEIVKEAQLANIAATFSATSVIDEEKIKETKFYYHAMKRLLPTLLLAKTSEISEDIPEDISWFRKIYSEVRNSSVGQLASLVTDSVIGSIEAVQIDVEKATKGIAKVNPALAIKRSNDAFQKSHFRTL